MVGEVLRTVFGRKHDSPEEASKFLHTLDTMDIIRSVLVYPSYKGSDKKDDSEFAKLSIERSAKHLLNWNYFSPNHKDDLFVMTENLAILNNLSAIVNDYDFVRTHLLENNSREDISYIIDDLDQALTNIALTLNDVASKREFDFRNITSMTKLNQTLRHRALDESITDLLTTSEIVKGSALAVAALNNSRFLEERTIEPISKKRIVLLGDQKVDYAPLTSKLLFTYSGSSFNISYFQAKKQMDYDFYLGLRMLYGLMNKMLDSNKGLVNHPEIKKLFLSIFDYHQGVYEGLIGYRDQIPFETYKMVGDLREELAKKGTLTDRTHFSLRTSNSDSGYNLGFGAFVKPERLN